MKGAPQPAAVVLDEMFSPRIASELRTRGHDVIAVAADPQLRSMTDGELYEWATTERRRIVTENVKDFRRLLLGDADRTIPGLLFTSARAFPRSRRAPGALIVALDGWLSRRVAATRPPEDWLMSRGQRAAAARKAP